MKIQWHDIRDRDCCDAIAIDVSNNGFGVLDTPKWRREIATTVIHRGPNGLGAIEWLDEDGASLVTHQGVLDEGTPGTRDHLPRIGKVEVIEYA